MLTSPIYPIGRLLGRGAFASTYSDPSGAVAIKVGKLGQHEAVLLSSGVQGIPRHLGAELVDGVSHLYMDLIPEPCKPKPFNIVHIMRTVCLTLRALNIYLRAKGFLSRDETLTHRDIKPANIRYDGRGNYYVIDWGSADKTAMGSVVGSTPPYSSPEMCSGHLSLTLTSDMWALGVMLYQAFTGKVLFEEMRLHPFGLAACLEELTDLERPKGLQESPHASLKASISLFASVPAVTEKLTYLLAGLLTADATQRFSPERVLESLELPPPRALSELPRNASEDASDTSSTTADLSIVSTTANPSDSDAVGRINDCV